MKRFWKVLGLLALAVMLIAGSLGTAESPWARAGEEMTLRAAENAGQPGEIRLEAKSKKKKKTPTPSPAASKTPAPENLSSIPLPTPVPEGPITDARSIADYLFSHDMQLPDNFLTKREAQALGWDSRYNYVGDVAPGMSIGGDYFGNYEGKLPTGKGISYREADCDYTGGKRNAKRVIYSSQGRVWYTEDHYNTFTELFPTGTSGGK